MDYKQKNLNEIQNLIAHIHETLAKAKTLGPPNDLYKQKKYYAYHVANWAQNNDIDPEYTIRKLLETKYDEAYSSIASLCPEDETNPEFELFQKALSSVPTTLPSTQITWNEDWENLQLDLWQEFEKGITFDLGDDGTDEMMEDMATVYHLLKISQYQLLIDEPYSWLSEAMIMYEFDIHNDQTLSIGIPDFPDDHIALLNLFLQHIEKYTYMDKAIPYIMNHIRELYNLDYTGE